LLRRATDAQKKAFEAVRTIFVSRNVRFTVIGGVACCEYGSPREANDLDVVVDNYAAAKKALLESGEFVLDNHDPDVTDRTCTQTHSTGVSVDVLTGGIRINDNCHLPGGIVNDLIPIPYASGYGNILPLEELIALKISVAISAERILELGANLGVRGPEKIQQDIQDVGSLISICKLDRNLTFDIAEITARYQEIYDHLGSGSLLGV
jgi:hypothetical protein